MFNLRLKLFTDSALTTIGLW